MFTAEEELLLMAYIANSPETYGGKVIGSGRCVAFVRHT
jgi:hypothetical protein